MKVKLDRQLGVSEWYVSISPGDVSTAVRKLRGKHLGLLPVSVQVRSPSPLLSIALSRPVQKEEMAAEKG